MIVPGVVSVTFRKLDAPTVVALAAEAGLAGIEWGSDVHVPSGDTGAAIRTRELCAEAGLKISSYGSYYRADTGVGEFEPVVRTAVALGAPSIRIWAGRLGSADASPGHRAAVARSVADAADLAAEHGVSINLEYHPGTLTDTLSSALDLLDSVATLRPSGDFPVRSYYQPFRATPADEAVQAVRALLDAGHLSHVHVFSWGADGTRLPLADRADLWRPVLADLAASDHHHPAQLEFVADDDSGWFRADATTLLNWVSELEEGS